MSGNELEKKKIDLLNEVKNQSLRSKMSDLRTKITKMNEYKNLTLLCDVSSSMSDILDNHESQETIRAIDVVNNIVKDFQGAQVFEFGTHCAKVPTNTEMRTRGGTNMGGAFATVKSHGVKEIILLTDGEPDSENHALLEANGLKINIIYIGPAPTPAFLIKLAKLTQGKFESVELIKLGKKGQEIIESKIKGFLSA